MPALAHAAHVQLGDGPAGPAGPAACGLLEHVLRWEQASGHWAGAQLVHSARSSDHFEASPGEPLVPGWAETEVTGKGSFGAKGKTNSYIPKKVFNTTQPVVLMVLYGAHVSPPVIWQSQLQRSDIPVQIIDPWRILYVHRTSFNIILSFYTSNVQNHK